MSAGRSGPSAPASALPLAGWPGEGGGGVRHRLEASLPPPKAGIGTGTRAGGNGTGGRPANRARGRACFLFSSRPPPWRDPPPLLRLRRRIPGPDCISFQPARLLLSRRPPPAPHSSRGALGPVPAPLVPLRAVLKRPGFPEVGRRCWAAVRGPGPLLTLRTRGRRGTGHRRGAGTASVTFTPGLLNHGAATSHPPSPGARGHPTLAPGPAVLSPGGGAASPHGSRLGDFATVSLGGAAAFTFPSAPGGSRLCFLPEGKAWLPSRRLGHFGSPGQSSIPTVS